MKDHVATTLIQRYWAVPGPARPAACRARHRRRGARRPRQLAARQDPGPRREDRGRGQRQMIAVPARRHVRDQRRGEAGRRSGRGRQAARRDRRRLSSPRARPRTRSQRAVMREVVGPNPRARAGRRLRRQGGRRWPRGRLYAGDSDFYKKTLAAYAADHAGRRCARAMQQWLGRPALTITLVAGRARSLCGGQERAAAAAKPACRRPKARSSAAIARSRRSASSRRSISRRSTHARCRTASRSTTRSAPRCR